MTAISEGDRQSPFAVCWFLREWGAVKCMTLVSIRALSPG